MDDTFAIEIENLWFSYNGSTVLEDLSLKIEKGDFAAVIGPNGGGKTTLLKLMLGLLKPRKGRIRVLGKTPSQASPNVGYVPQNVNANNEFPVSALDVTLMGGLFPGKGRTRGKAALKAKALEILDRMNISHLANRRIGALSVGQRQRVFIARALLSEPGLLLLDEPAASIDNESQTEFYALLKQLNASATIVVVSHDLMVLSTYVKSVVCVNRQAHHHNEPQITGDMLGMYHCPVELVAHGVPHRVLARH